MDRRLAEKKTVDLSQSCTQGVIERTESALVDHEVWGQGTDFRGYSELADKQTKGMDFH